MIKFASLVPIFIGHLNSKQDYSLRTKTGKLIGLIDADLLDNGTRHPNLVLLKLAGYFRDHKIPYELIYDASVDLEKYYHIYLSQVFTFTNEPAFIKKYKAKHPKKWKTKITEGGTGFYATLEDRQIFSVEREKDVTRLKSDPLLSGFSMAHQMPDYELYNCYISSTVSKKIVEERRNYIRKNKKEPSKEEIEVFRIKHLKKYKDYHDYSIGFLTRGCIRQCPFCVNKNERMILPYSELGDFVDDSRPFIYLWDDNFLCYKNWKELLQKLIDTGKPFQFRQGLDERVIDEERARMLSKAHYHGDFIFAFDQWKDRDLIVRKLRIWKTYCPSRTTKFYLFCGYELTADNDTKIFEDVYFLFRRIQILMSFGCLGYVMRHADYQNHRLGNIYTQIARWCNQPQFYKKMSFEEFILRNQSYQEEHSSSTRTCKSLSTYTAFKETFSDRWGEIEPLFQMKYESTINESLWKINNE
ncbi:MAG: hypothetical protein KBT27_12310 [Prevotellaceae bacterium]|nr:hypothetical protein [Candidatus Faecinaster equi]